jgi:hypothetical protein
MRLSQRRPPTTACEDSLRHNRRARSPLCCCRAVIAACLLLALPGLAQTTVNIHAIQTDLPASPYLGDTVTTSGIVIAVLSDGFYVENSPSSWDSDVCTVEGIYVYTPSGVPSNAVLENDVAVTGEIEASNNSNYAGTLRRAADKWLNWPVFETQR